MSCKILNIFEVVENWLSKKENMINAMIVAINRPHFPKASNIGFLFLFLSLLFCELSIFLLFIMINITFSFYFYIESLFFTKCKGSFFKKRSISSPNISNGAVMESKECPAKCGVRVTFSSSKNG